MADGSGNYLHSVYSFDNINGTAPIGGLTLAGNGKLYGATLLGGYNNSCVIFSYNPSTGIATNIYDFAAFPQYGDDAHSEMILANNGKMYGLCNYGGLHNKGTIFELDTLNNYTDLLDFTDSTGAVPWGKLLQASNGLLYGMTSKGGANNIGTIFSYNITTHAYTTLYSFTSATGDPLYGYLGLMQATNGKLYGMTESGGTLGFGVIFSFDIATNIYTDIHNFNGTQGADPEGTLMQASNGKLYGMTDQGGTGNGVLFSYNISTNTFSDLLNFNGTQGGRPRRTLTQASNGKLYGTTYKGGINNIGVAFSFNIANNTYTKLIDFNNSSTGSYPDCNFIETPVMLNNCASTSTLNVTSSSCTGYTLNSQTYYTSGTYIQYLTNVQGCDSMLTLNLSFGTNPVVTVNSTYVCQGSSVMLTANGATTYTWSAGATPTGVNTATVSPTVTTTYSVTGTTATGCAMAVSTVTVLQSPQIPIVGESNTLGGWGDNSFRCCTGDPVYFYIDNFFNPGTNFTWSGPSGVVSYNQDWNIPSAAAFMSGNYVLTATYMGCSSVSDTFHLMVGQTPLICCGGTQTICSGGIASFTPSFMSPPFNLTFIPYYYYYMTVSASSPNVSGYWNGGILTSGFSQFLTNSGTTAETVTYTIIPNCYNGMNCPGNPVTFTVTVKPNPHVTVNSSIICQPGLDTLIANGASTYTWSAGATPFGINSASVNPTSTTTYTVTGTLNGCTNTAVATVSVNPTPVVTVTAPAICAGQAATLTANGAAAYTWSAGVTPTGVNTATVSPTVTTTYTVTGTTCGNSVSTTVTVVVNPVPNVTVNSPTICAGTTTTLNASGATSYIWSAGATSTGISTATVSPTVTTTYTVTGNSVCGISNTAIATVTVNPVSVITVNSSTICRGDTAHLVVTGGTSYTWYSPPLPTVTGVGTAIAYPISTTIYHVTGYSAGCSSTAMSTVTVIQLPNVTVNSPTICAGNAAILDANGASSYTWSAGVSVIGIDSASASPMTTTTYTVTGTTGTCSKTAVSTVTVNPPLTVTVNSPAICSGQTATLVAGGASAYTWSAGATSTGVTTATAAPTANTTYTVTGTSGTCTGSAIATVTVNPLPIVTATATSPTICQNGIERLNGGGASTYVWNNGIYDNAPFPISYQVNDTVVGTDIHGCTGSSSITITLLPIPSVTAHATPGTICQGDSVILWASGTAMTFVWSNGVTNGVSFAPATSATYTVTGTGLYGCTNADASYVTVNPLSYSTINSSTCNSYTLNSQTYTSSGTYYQTLTNFHGCDSILTLNLTITNNINTIVAITGDTLTSNQSGATYQWLDCSTTGNLPIAGQTNQTFVATTNGQYAVALNLGGCTDTSACVFFYSVGQSQIPNPNSEIIISPNPFTEQTTITFDKEQKNTTIKIFNLLGECVLAPPPFLQGGNKQLLAVWASNGESGVVLDLSSIAKGIYFIQIQTNNQTINRKIIKQGKQPVAI